jgi:hypothetical protein
MVGMRKTLKILHTLATAGIVGGLAVYMILLVTAPQGTPEAYADLRQSIAAISNYVLLPSLAVVLVSGLFAMVAHSPYLDKGWVWLKAGSGILMFKGVLTIVGAKADYAAVVSQRIADGDVAAEVLERALAYEWLTLWIMMALSVANVVLGVWRPKLSKEKPRRPAAETAAEPAAEPVASAATQPVAAAEPAPRPARRKEARPAAAE